MAESFAIYAAPRGYVAVTSPVRQRILRRLEDGEATLTQLVKLTGRAKSTLSGVHLRDLLASGLVIERPDDVDARVKRYRLGAKRIGSSSVPLEDLRDAVRRYVASSEGALALPLASIAEAFDQLPRLRPDEARWVGLVGERLGSRAAARLRAREPAAVLREVAEVWRRGGLGRVVRAQGASQLELTPPPGARPGGTRCALLQGFLQGALTTRSGLAARVAERACASRAERGGRCAFAVTWPAGR